MAAQSLQLMLYGLAGVFSSLAILYIFIKIIVKVFPHKDK
jgi:Na+-transporting methylmalonyl-CoA/oxaloacetate decarboxylase gamma subunit